MNGTTTSHGYSPQATLSSLAHNLAGTAQDQTYSYTRNQAREITATNWTNDTYQWAGVPGNVTNGARSYSANGRNQYAAAAGATIAHDANGNLTSHPTSDGTWTYAYDLDNRLKTASKAAAGSVGAINAALYYDGAGTLKRRYVHGPGVDKPLVAYEGTTTTDKSWLYKDHLGSVIGTADATGTSTAIYSNSYGYSYSYSYSYSYGPYGEPNTTTGQRFRYTGQQLICQYIDATLLQNYQE